MTETEIARTVFEAWRDRRATNALSQLATSRDAETGYAIQRELNRLFADAQRKRIGWKLGLTSQPALDLFGAQEPMVGVIYADSILEDGARLGPDQTISPRIEGEMLLEIAAMPPPDADDAALVASLASVSAAFEIADSRLEGWPSAIGGAIADNACCGWLMRAPQVVAPDRVDFEGTAMSIARNGEVIVHGQASACLGSVLETYRWFIADSHRRGRTLRTGEIVLTGAMGPALPMEADGVYTLDCGKLGEVRLPYREAP